MTTPTLVMHPRGATFPTLDMARKLAAGIPDARLKVLESETYWSDEMEPQFLDALDEFIGDGGRPESDTLQPQARRAVQKVPGFATVLFTDIVGHTEMMSRLGDERGREVLREHERITREVLAAHEGTEVKTMGDGFMASFSSATKALECAIALQISFAERDESAEEPMKVRIGLNAGEPIAEDDPGGRGDLFGTAVNVAARIAAKADGGEILVADVVRQLVAGKEFLFNDRGDTELRGFEDPVRVFEVSWREEA